MEISRRDALKVGTFGAVALLLPLQRTVNAASALPPRLAPESMPVPFAAAFAVPPRAVPVRTDATTDYYRIVMRPTTVEIAPGISTPMWGYDGAVPGPTISAQQGRRVVVRQVNALPEIHPTLRYAPWTSVHLHGSASDPEYDGYASDVSNPGQYKDYHYPNMQCARTLWYHDHGVSHTAENVSMGLAAQYHLHDSRELSLPVPHGDYDVPIVLGDTMLAADGSILFDNHFESGFYGDIVLVNGRPWPTMRVARRKYRFRIVNASVSRSYRLVLSSGDPITVIGTDAGLMPKPVSVPSLKQGMAERYEIVIDFSRYPAGYRLVLGNQSPKNNIRYADTDKIMAFDVTDEDFDPGSNLVPRSLAPDNVAMTLPESAAVRTRVFNLVRTGGHWTINGRTWEDVVASGFTYVEADPGLGETEIWELHNDSGGWFHPVHIHLVDFRVLSRNGRPPFPHERGPKDVVYLGEKETVRLLMRFERPGKYMMHCHNLVHEDHDMMTQFEVGHSTGAADPLSDPCSSGAETEL